MKVLMLGWEFPPFFSGGLGVATLGIVSALRHRVDIKLIIPSNSGSPSLSNVNIIGLNSVASQELDLERLQHRYEGIATAVHRIPLDISPYQFVNEALFTHKSEESSSTPSGKKDIETIHSIFSDNDVYGATMLRKLHLYTQLAEQIAMDGDFDVIHAHDWITFSAGTKIKMNSGRPLVLHIHSLETDRAGENVRNEIYRVEKEGMIAADRIISVSQFTKDQIVKHYGIDPGKIDVVHNGIDPAEKPRKQHPLRDKLVVFLGRLTHQKGPEFLLETAEKVSRVYTRVKFVVAGTGDEFARLLEASAYKKMGSKFIFAGFLSKASADELLSIADVYFMPSVSEPFGLTALEAVQHHIPSVLSAQSGAAEVIKASLIADFWDTDKYANYIYALLKYDALGETLSENAASGLNSLTWDTAAEKIWKVYQQLSTSLKN